MSMCRGQWAEGSPIKYCILCNRLLDEHPAYMAWMQTTQYEDRKALNFTPPIPQQQKDEGHAVLDQFIERMVASSPFWRGMDYQQAQAMIDAAKQQWTIKEMADQLRTAGQRIIPEKKTPQLTDKQKQQAESIGRAVANMSRPHDVYMPCSKDWGA